MDTYELVGVLVVDVADLVGDVVHLDGDVRGLNCAVADLDGYLDGEVEDGEGELFGEVEDRVASYTSGV